MTRLRGLVPFTLLLLSAARRNTRTDDSDHRALVKALEVSAKAREALLPGGIGRAPLRNREERTRRARMVKLEAPLWSMATARENEWAAKEKFGIKSGALTRRPWRRRRWSRERAAKEREEAKAGSGPAPSEGFEVELAADSKSKMIGAIRETVGLKDAEVRRILKQVPAIRSYDFDAASLKALQQRLGLTDKELKAIVLRLPQVLGDNYEDTIAPGLSALQLRLALSDAELSFLVKKLPQMLGLDFEALISPSLDALQQEAGLTDKELKEAVLSKPADLLKAGVVVRGGSLGPKGKAARTAIGEDAADLSASPSAPSTAAAGAPPPDGFTWGETH